MGKLPCFSIVFLILFVLEASAFDNKYTHRLMTERAILNSEISETIARDLKLDDGTAALVSGRSITDWLKEGAFQEDEPDCRASNHFHNPLRTWTASHMTDRPWLIDLCCSGGD